MQQVMLIPTIDVEAAILQCTKENGGKLVGNPTVQRLAKVKVEGQKISLIFYDSNEDRNGWWDEYARIHSLKVKAK